jgi:hypothetical protein
VLEMRMGGSTFLDGHWEGFEVLTMGEDWVCWNGVLLFHVVGLT